jgi:hypothetical protein
MQRRAQRLIDAKTFLDGVHVIISTTSSYKTFDHYFLWALQVHQALRILEILETLETLEILETSEILNTTHIDYIQHNQYSKHNGH